MAVQQGREYNPETARDLRPRAFHFVAHGQDFRTTLQIPAYILARLDDSRLSNELQDYMERYASRVVVEAIRGGYLFTDTGRASMRSDVAKHLRNYVWERFSITQQDAGHEAWQTAPTLQDVLTI
jgi:hypothetical protein